MSKKRKATLTTQSQHWFITIRKNIDLSKPLLKQWCESHAVNNMYAFIEHKGDISPTTNEVEGTHYHIVMDSLKRPQKIHLLNDLVRTFGFETPFGIEVDTYDTFEGCLQYLTHQNEPTKTQHDRREIITNIDNDTFNALLDTPLASSLTTGSLIAYINQCSTPIQLCEMLGLGTFDHYLRSIRILWKCCKGYDM